MPAADAARAVIGPDDPAAARMVVVGIVAADIIAPVEVAVAVVRPIDPVAMKSAIAVNATIAIATTMEGRRGAEAAAMKAAATEAAEMSSATAEATAAVKMSATTMPAAAVPDLRDEIVGRSFRRG